MKIMHKNTAFTLIELIMVIVVSAILFLGISIPLQTALVQGVAPEYQAVAAMLAEREMERIIGNRFSVVATVALTPFPSPYQRYSYSISVEYVQGPNNLDTPSVSVTDYKRVKITVSHPTTGNVALTTLLTRNDY